ncbi:MAG: hypothetical protein H6582_10495 [Crocinitomicaceae bacterium]|nr:hypothetical protein [Crocinitomicaceae bacterium]
MKNWNYIYKDMSLIPHERNNIDQFFSKEKFVLDTCQQINKDLAGLVQFEPNISVDIDENVLDQLVNILKDILLQMDSAKIQQFIYKVDLKESAFIRAVSQEDDFQNLALLIIEREAQKVYLRHKFSP